MGLIDLAALFCLDLFKSLWAFEVFLKKSVFCSFSVLFKEVNWGKNLSNIRQKKRVANQNSQI